MAVSCFLSNEAAATNHLSRDCCDLLLAQAQALKDPVDIEWQRCKPCKRTPDMPRPKPQDLEAASRNAKEQTSKGVAVSQQLELLYANYVWFLFNIYIQYLTLWSPGIQCRESLHFEDDVQAINPSGDHQISKVKGFPASLLTWR